MKKNQAFTLIELSIVLVIIGLIVGGVIGGKSLVKNARMGRVVSDVANYQMAFNNFSLQYDALPGDMRDASSYFSALGCPSGCNGDGDGKIEWYAEPYLAWFHLSAAGMIEGNFVGERSNSQSNPDSDVPSASFDGAFYFPQEGYIYNRGGNTLRLSKNNGQYPTGSVFNTPDAVTIDKKMDDGKADRGSVYGANGDYNSAVCTDAGRLDVDPPPTAANYTLSNQNVACRLIFWLYQ